MGGYTVALAGLGALTVFLRDVSAGRATPEGLAATTGAFFCVGLFLSMWIANFLMLQQSKR